MAEGKNTLALELVRDRQDATATQGRLFGDGISLYTLERPWLDNQRGVSCIPTGLYHGAVQHSPHFNRDLPELLDVPGRSQILLHVGNTPADSQGCILVGLGRDEKSHSITQSRLAVIALLEKLESFDAFTLEVKDAA